jgi:phosphatidyl-myo-inositol alpha-mannosyltransferase
MKIGFVFDDSLDKNDGVQQYIKTLGIWMSAHGHDVHYLVGETHCSKLKNVHSMSRNLKINFNKNTISTPLPGSSNKIKQIIQQQKFDVLHVQVPYSPFMAGRVIHYALPGTAIVGTFHIIPSSILVGLATSILAPFIRNTLNRFNTMLSVSTAANTFCKKSLGLNSVIIPNIVDLEFYRSYSAKVIANKPKKIQIVFLGRLVERKGCKYLLRALNKLHEQQLLSNVDVTICGMGKLRKKLETYTKRHGLEEIVHFVGFVSDTQKARYLTNADIAVFPSIGGESFGIVLIEAMAVGKPVVLGGNNIGYKTVLGDKPDQLVDVKNTEEFSNKLLHYITNNSSRRKAVNWQKKIVKSYDVNKVGLKIIESYQQSIAKEELKLHNKH